MIQSIVGPAAVAAVAPCTTLPTADVDLVTFRLGHWHAQDRDGRDPLTRVLIVTLDGNLCAENREMFKRYALDELHEGRRYFVLDLTECGYADASALGALVGISNRVRREKGRLVLCGLNEDLATLFELTRMDMVLEVVPTLLDALATFDATVIQ